jgi:glycosyltransferase involved in cell wall biosynthesis
LEHAINITLVITNLDAGGAERVISNMANYWAQKGWSATLLTFDDRSVPPFYEIDQRVNHIPLGIYQPSSNSLEAVWNNLRRIQVLRRAIRRSKPDAVISFLFVVNILVLLATRGLAVPVIISERTDPLLEPVDRAWKWLRQWTYSFASRIIVATERTKEYFLPSVQAKTTVIPNPVAPASSEGSGPPEVVPAKPAIVAMGRLYRQKGYDILLKAFAHLQEKHPDWTLTILGEGPLRQEIERLRAGLGLVERVHLPGSVRNPHNVLRKADLFVLSSRWEGWNNSLAEAMSCGLPVIAADCRSGPREVIRHGVDGVLVPPEDVEALAAEMDRLMSDESARKLLASRAVEVVERFDVDKIMSMWEELLRSVVGSAKGLKERK